MPVVRSTKENDHRPVQCLIIQFKAPQSENYIQVNSRKSFSKSAEKKLKLLSRMLSEQKNIYIPEKRSIKPLKFCINLNLNKNKKQTQEICSIKKYKTKINFQKNQTDNQSRNAPKNSSIFSLSTNYIKRNVQQNKEKDYSFSNIKIPQNETLLSSKNSLVINEGKFYITSSAPSFGNSIIKQNQTKNTIQKSEKFSSQNGTNFSSFNESNAKFSVYNSTNVMQFQSSQFTTPIKNKYFTEQNIYSQNSKKQKLTLNNARKVQTLETLKTQNQMFFSFIDDQKIYQDKEQTQQLFNKQSFSKIKNKLKKFQ